MSKIILTTLTVSWNGRRSGVGARDGGGKEGPCIFLAHFVIFFHTVCTTTLFDTLSVETRLFGVSYVGKHIENPVDRPSLARGANHSQESRAMIHRTSHEINLAGDTSLSSRIQTRVP